MKLIFVAGIEDSGKDAILDMVLTGSKHRLPPFDYVRFDDVFFNKEKSISPRFGHRALAESMDFSGNAGQITKAREQICKKLDSKLKEKSNVDKFIIVNGYFIINTLHGYVPVVSEQFFSSFKPGMIVLMEAEDSDKSRHMLKRGPEYPESVRIQQEINRNYASLYTSATDAVLRIIKVRHGDIKSAIRELREALFFAMK